MKTKYNQRPANFVIFGGSGDLTSRHLMPSLYRMWKAGKLPQHFRIIGAGLSMWNDEHYRTLILQQMVDRGFPIPDDWAEFASHLQWQYMNLDDEESLPDYKQLKSKMVAFDSDLGDSKWVYYLALPPACFAPVIKYLAGADMLENPDKQVVAIEKPIGKSLESARHLVDLIENYCQPNQVVCVEHFALKPMTQSMVQFIRNKSSSINKFQPYNISNIEVIALENIGVPEARQYFYDACSALPDMYNHLIVPMLSELVVNLDN
jgi:glucose-6-phosphate 1-dehydrogenase